MSTVTQLQIAALIMSLALFGLLGTYAKQSRRAYFLYALLSCITFFGMQAVVIPAITAPLTWKQQKAIYDYRVRWWTNYFKERSISHLALDIDDVTELSAKCQAYIHYEAFNVLKAGDLKQVEEIEHLCVFDDTNAVLVPYMVEETPFDNVWLLGHGIQNSLGKETFANGFRYETFANIAKAMPGKTITILSCRGTREDARLYFKYKYETFESDKADEIPMVRSTLPHREGNLFVYGRKGAMVAADLANQYKGWKMVMAGLK